MAICGLSSELYLMLTDYYLVCWMMPESQNQFFPACQAVHEYQEQPAYVLHAVGHLNLGTDELETVMLFLVQVYHAIFVSYVLMKIPSLHEMVNDQVTYLSLTHENAVTNYWMSERVIAGMPY